MTVGESTRHNKRGRTMRGDGRSGRWADLLILAVAACTAAGCGSTVAPGASVGSAANAGLGSAAGLSAPTSSNATGPAAAAGVGIGVASSATGVTPSGGAASQSTTGTGAGGPTNVAPGMSGYGFDAKHVYIGVGVSSDASAFAKSIGLAIQTGNEQAQEQALIDYINAHGGLAGRQIVPVWYDVNSYQYSSDPAGTAQSECATWTQDHHVFAAIEAMAYPDNGIACLAKAHTVAFNSGGAAPVETAELQHYSPYFYTPGMAESSRLVGPLIDALVREGYFRGWDTTNAAPGTAPVKIGVFYASDRTDLLNLTKAALARYGMTVTDTFYQGSASDDSQLPGAMLKFKADGVTHVLTYGSLAGLPEIAAGQGYYPRYGVSSWDGLQISQAAGSPKDFAGALGIAWTPLLDVDAAHDPGESAAEKKCVQIEHAAGQDTSNRTTQAVMAAECGQWFLLQGALAGVSLLSPSSVQQGIDAVGARFDSPLTFGERFGPNRHAGAAVYRPVAFLNSCSCFAYTGKDVSFS